MTNNEIRIAIAEACGFELRETEELVANYPGGILPTKVMRWFLKGDMFAMPLTFEDLPNYPEDLNAMNDAEKSAALQGLRAEYCRNLSFLQTGVHDPVQWPAVIAPAHQRAEAFLRTIGKWKEAQ